MQNYKKPSLFRIIKIRKNRENNVNEEGNNHFSSENKNRNPWAKEEDDAVIKLVEEVGNKNWTLLARKLSEGYSYIRTGKQCRERWHNHLDPGIKKDYWSEEEEKTLMLKHMEFGNKWSDIAKFLPGRTDNTIKNHFYSKLRKFIRKIVKVLHKENVFTENSIDDTYYTPERIYKIIKKQKIPYDSLSKDSIIDMILKHDIHNINGNNSKSRRDDNSKGFKKAFKPINQFSGGVNVNTGNKGFFKPVEAVKTEPIVEENLELNTILNVDKFGSKRSLLNNNLQDMPNPLVNSQSVSSLNSQMLNNINALNQLINNINMPNNNNSSSNMNTENEENFTVKLIQNLNEIQNANVNINNNQSINQMNSNNYFVSQNNTDNLSMNCFNYPMNRSAIHYPYDSLNDLYTMNMSRIVPQMNGSMSNFTLGNNTYTSQNHDKKMNNFYQKEAETENHQISEILINNLINNPSLRNKPQNTTMNFFVGNNNEENDPNCNFGRNLSFSVDNDALFNPEMNNQNGNLANSMSNTSRSFQKMKSFNCVEPDVLHEEHGSSSFYVPHNSNYAKSPMNHFNHLNANCFPFANINTNSPGGYEVSNFEKFKNFCELQQIFNKNNQTQTNLANQTHHMQVQGNNQFFGNNLNMSLGLGGSSMSQSKSPAISPPKSTFIKNISQNYPQNLSNFIHMNVNNNSHSGNTTSNIGK